MIFRLGPLGLGKRCSTREWTSFIDGFSNINYPFWGISILGYTHFGKPPYLQLIKILDWIGEGRSTIQSGISRVKQDGAMICWFATLPVIGQVQFSTDWTDCWPSLSQTMFPVVSQPSQLSLWGLLMYKKAWTYDGWIMILSLSLYTSMLVEDQPSQWHVSFSNRTIFWKAFTRKARRWCCIRSAVWPAHRVTHLRSLLSQDGWQDGWQPEHDSLRT